MHIMTRGSNVRLAIRKVRGASSNFVVVGIGMPRGASGRGVLISFNGCCKVTRGLVRTGFESRLGKGRRRVRVCQRGSTSVREVVRALSSGSVNLPPRAVRVRTGTIAKVRGIGGSSSGSRGVGINQSVGLSRSALGLNRVGKIMAGSVGRLPASRPGGGRLGGLLIRMESVLGGASSVILPPRSGISTLSRIGMLTRTTRLPRRRGEAMNNETVHFLRQVISTVPASLPMTASLITRVGGLVPRVTVLLNVL